MEYATLEQLSKMNMYKSLSKEELLVYIQIDGWKYNINSCCYCRTKAE